MTEGGAHVNVRPLTQGFIFAFSEVQWAKFASLHLSLGCWSHNNSGCAVSEWNKGL